MGEKDEVERSIPRRGDNRFPTHDPESWRLRAQATSSPTKGSPTTAASQAAQTRQETDEFDV